MIFRSPTDSERQMADLSALADGSIAPERRAQIEQQIAQSAELRAQFERERAVVELLEQARESEHAPEQLRRRIAAQRRQRAGVPQRRLGTLASGVAVAASVAAVTAVLLLTGGPSGGPSVAQAAGLATRGALAPAPQVDPHHPWSLTQAVGDVYFPNWGHTLGWTATGARADRLGNHRALTVYYRWHGRQVAYTIVSVPSLAQPSADPVALGGIRLRALSLHGRMVVTWRRDGRTCVLSSRDVPARQLEQLAAWRPAAQRY